MSAAKMFTERLIVIVVKMNVTMIMYFFFFCIREEIRYLGRDILSNTLIQGFRETLRRCID
jgi:hypothetical protein